MVSFTKNEKSLIHLARLALIVLAMSLFMGKAGQQSLQAMDSSLHARLALDVTSAGIRPVLPIRSLDGGFNQGGFNDHPFFLFYLNGWFMRAFGANAWTARFLPSLFGVGCVGLLAGLGTLLYGPVEGLVAGFILTFSLPFANYAARFQLDPAMIFFILLSTLGWWLRRPFWVGLGAGLGIWMKSPVSLLIFPAALLSLVFTRSTGHPMQSSRTNRQEIVLIFKSLSIALGVGASIWIFTAWIGGWEVATDYWRRQVLGTAVGGRGDQQGIDFFLFTEALRRRYWPWLLLLVFSLGSIIRKRRWRSPEVALPLASVCVVIGVISCMRFKLDHYYLPMYPFLALLCVDGIRRWVERKRIRLLQFCIGLGLLLPSLLLAFPVELAPEMFPALRKFNAIIQSYGSCQDPVMYIGGMQPYGTAGDYSVEIAFYSNRPFFESQCQDADRQVQLRNPRWIIVFGKNETTCLGEDVRAQFPVRYQFGNQVLLTNRVPSGHGTDLTPLMRELEAPLDCDPAELPRNRYYRYE